VRERPVITIEAGRKWAGFDLTDLWQHRDLFVFLTWRDVKVRYKQTVLGPLWFFVQPFLASVVFMIMTVLLALVTDRKPQAEPQGANARFRMQG